MDSGVKHAERRAYRYWYEDGFIDILLGAFFLLVALTSWLPGAPLPTGLATIVELAMIALVLGAAIALRAIVRRLKQRVTYPRTGYVAYRRRSPWLRWVKVAIGVVVGAAVGLLATSHSGIVRWLPVLEGALIGVALLTLGIRFALARYHVLALVAVLLGGALALGDLSGRLRLVAFLGGMGLALIVAGGGALVTYLRRNPLRGGEV